MRASHRANLAPPALLVLVKTHFESGELEAASAVASYGAISRLVVSAAGRELSVDVVMNPKVPEEVARETIRRYNQFLEAVTGYSSKERARRLRKSAGESRTEG